MSRVTRALLVIVMPVSLAACHKVEARMPTPPPVMALEIPTPPARVTIPVDLPEPPAALPQPAASTTRPRPDAPPVSRTPAAPAAQTPPASETPTSAGPVTTDNGAQERKTLSLIEEATRNLQTVAYRDLPPQAKAQYDSAMSFIKNARLALQNKNYMYAEQLATKAAAVARELGKS